MSTTSEQSMEQEKSESNTSASTYTPGPDSQRTLEGILKLMLDKDELREKRQEAKEKRKQQEREDKAKWEKQEREDRAKWEKQDREDKAKWEKQAREDQIERDRLAKEDWEAKETTRLAKEKQDILDRNKREDLHFETLRLERVADRERAEKREETRYTAVKKEHKSEMEKADKKKREAEKRNNTLGRHGKLGEGENLDKYLQRLETVLEANEVPVADWTLYLHTHLTGNPLTHLTTILSAEQREDYHTAKEALLKLSGYTLDSCADQVFHLNPPPWLSNDNIMEQCQYLMGKFRDAASDVDDMADQMAQRLCLSAFSKDCAAHVSNLQVSDKVEFMFQLQVYQDQHGRHFRNQYRGEAPNPPRREFAPPRAPPRPHNYSQHDYSSVRGPPRPSQHQPSYPRYRDSGGRDTPFCYRCGQSGHLRHNCPNRGRQDVKSEGEPPVKLVRKLNVNIPTLPTEIKATVRGAEIICQMDCGAEISVVRKGLVAEEEFTGQDVRLTGALGSWGVFPVAEVTMDIGGDTFTTPAAVVPDGTNSINILLGGSIGVDRFFKLFASLSPSAKVNLTRAQAAKQSKDEAETVLIREKEQVVLKDPGEITQAEPQVTPPSTEQVEDAGEVELTDPTKSITVTPPPTEPDREGEGDLEMQMPLPLEGDGQERQEFAKETNSDPTLRRLREKANRTEQGYAWKDQLLTRTVQDEFGHDRLLLVVPHSQRGRLLSMSHDLARHQGREKMGHLLSRSFMWPGMSDDIKRHGRSCPTCQRLRKQGEQKAPLQEVPVFTTPFKHLALDIVGPFKTSRAGYKYLLTCICLASRYPEAIPLKKATAEEVADKLLEVFARFGIPDTILTDQGSNFVGELMGKLCKTLNIKQLRTTPYHPEANGVVERFHGTLVPMLRKAAEANHIDWPMYVPMSLFYIRAVQNRCTGYSPFELVFGENPQTPLDLLADSLVQAKAKSYRVGEWVDRLHNRLTLLRTQAEEVGLRAKEKTRLNYNKAAKENLLEKGEMVLLRLPGLQGKLESNWEGPYEIMDRVSDVNYKLNTSSSTGKETTKTVHRNNMKQFRQDEMSIHRLIMAADEDTDLLNTKVELKGQALAREREQEINSLLSKWDFVMSDTPGNTHLVTHHLPTGSQQPIRAHPHRLAPKWTEDIHKEIEELLKQGIIVRSHSPWSSPIVPVRKANGSVRMCIDYRRLNMITTPDPFEMPLVEELLEKVGSATHLSKLDLSKGFYQVQMHADDMEKTAFCSPWGKFHFQRMPFGLRNAPATFQRLMGMALEGQGTYAIPYLDDVLIYSSSWEDHLVHIDRVLSSLQKAGLTVKSSKCDWGKASLQYLGHEIGNGKVLVPEMRVQAMRDYKQPTTKKGIRSFLGTTGYYRRFIQGYGGLVQPFTNCLKKLQPDKLTWTTAMREAFDSLRENISNIAQLTIPIKGDSFTLQTDASYLGIGGVLSVTRDGKETPTGFYSRQLKDRERNYSATEIECLGVVESIRHFEVHLIGQSFRLETDHRALEFLLSSRVLNRRLTRWALFLQEFQFSIVYRSGNKNCNADGLSRQDWEASDTNHHPRTDGTFEGGGDVVRATGSGVNEGCSAAQHPHKGGGPAREKIKTN